LAALAVDRTRLIDHLTHSYFWNIIFSAPP
jgi:hypothetical protein